MRVVIGFVLALCVGIGAYFGSAQAAGAVALIAGAWPEKTASMGPTCSAWDTRNERTISKGGWDRYCGPGRAVLRVDGKVFRIKHGTCHRTAYSVGFGLLGYGDKFPNGRGMDLHLGRAGDLDGPIRAGRNSVFDGEVQLPGYGSLPHTGHAIVAKHLKGGTFSLGSRANRVTGRFSCG